MADYHTIPFKGKDGCLYAVDVQIENLDQWRPFHGCPDYEAGDVYELVNDGYNQLTGAYDMSEYVMVGEHWEDLIDEHNLNDAVCEALSRRGVTGGQKS